MYSLAVSSTVQGHGNNTYQSNSVTFMYTVFVAYHEAGDAGDEPTFIIKSLIWGQGALATVHANSRVVESFGQSPRLFAAFARNLVK